MFRRTLVFAAMIAVVTCMALSAPSASAQMIDPGHDMIKYDPVVPDSGLDFGTAPIPAGFFGPG